MSDENEVDLAIRPSWRLPRCGRHLGRRYPASPYRLIAIDRLAERTASLAHLRRRRNRSAVNSDSEAREPSKPPPLSRTAGMSSLGGQHTGKRVARFD